MEYSRDPGYVRFRQGSVKLGAMTALIGCAMIAAYLAATWNERPHRGAMAVLVTVTVLGAGAIVLARAERVVETRWCDVFFAAWSTSYVIVIAVFALLDGGATSPFIALFFPVLVFAGLCYPLRLAVYVGIACVLGDISIGLVGNGDYLPLQLIEHGHDLDRILFVAGSLALSAVMCAWQAYTLEGHRRELALASRTDHLTGALNRRGFHERAEAELARARRSGDPLALVLVDLDGFKRVNDAHGHAAGDELLCWVVDRLRIGLRPSDAAARLGGDEFALLLPGIDAEGARGVMERLCKMLAVRTAASLGAATFPERPDTDALLAHADAELYVDKARSRGAATAALKLEAIDGFWA